MLEFLRANQFVVGALSGSLAAFLLGLIVQHLRRPKKWLSYQIVGRRIAEKRNPKLAVSYDGRPIETMHSVTVQIQNTGNRALMDVPVTFQCTEPAEIVEFDVTAPQGAKFQSSLDIPRTLLVRCDLLNIGEKASVGITTVNGQSERPSDLVSVTARQEDLECRRMFPVDLFSQDRALRLLYRLAQGLTR